jgi:predicted nuclease of restriction endonuclease-like (RecB) superfamily
MPARRKSPDQLPAPSGFDEILSLIQSARQRAFQAVNVELVDLYWQVGQTISRKIEAAEWGDGVVDQLASFLARTQPGLKGFSRQNIFRMKQFYEVYRDSEIVSPLVRQLPWTHNLIILSQSKHTEESAQIYQSKIEMPKRHSLTWPPSKAWKCLWSSDGWHESINS